MEKYQLQKCQLEKTTSFVLKDILECGQCFRWNKQEDGSYIGVVRNNVIHIKQEQNAVMIEGVGEEKLEEMCYSYFDMGTNYEKIQEKLSKVDNYVKQSVSYGSGIRILNQDFWEILISFIISANNNIPRIKGIIEKLARAYGKEITFKSKSYYTFPTPEELGKATIEELRKLGLGFRDKRVYETTKLVIEGKISLEQIKQEKDTKKVREILLTIPGVGPKVADCILLFALKRYEVFPIDVWVRRVMNELYLKNPEEDKVDKKEIEKLAYEKFGNLAGLAQQYLFYWRRGA